MAITSNHARVKKGPLLLEYIIPMVNLTFSQVLVKKSSQIYLYSAFHNSYHFTVALQRVILLCQ